MADQPPLSPDQIARIAATLQRIRAGLSRFKAPALAEPAHVYKPEALDDPQP